MKKTDWLVALTLTLCIIALAGCGGGSGSGETSAAAREEAGLEFAACMREHGVEMEDPSSQGGAEAGTNLDPSDPATRKALAACKGKLDRATQETSPEEDEEFKEGWLAFAQCVREQGIDMPDPRFLGPGKVRLRIAGIDTSSPAFEAAREACQSKVPNTTGVTVGG